MNRGMNTGGECALVLKPGKHLPPPHPPPLLPSGQVRNRLLGTHLPVLTPSLEVTPHNIQLCFLCKVQVPGTLLRALCRQGRVSL